MVVGGKSKTVAAKGTPRKGKAREALSPGGAATPSKAQAQAAASYGTAPVPAAAPLSRAELQKHIDQRLHAYAAGKSHEQAAIDARIEAWLQRAFAGEGEELPQLPRHTVSLDKAGMARELSLPLDKDSYESPTLQSWRVRNGMLHNPASDRRTTKGVFHIVEGSDLAVPDDKKSVPARCFLRMMRVALQPPDELSQLPYKPAGSKQDTKCLVSLLMRPVVVPAVPGYCGEKRYEIRFFVPGSLVSNLDFVESIFGNGGEASLPENDAALDPATWTGHSGCVVLAPHLMRLTKKELGLPHWDAATELQRRDSMCWREEDELYNDGGAFKLCARDSSGCVVTLIADNYYGYCKKEVKTQISFSANLFGMAEEEHSGGALVYPSYDLGLHHNMADMDQSGQHTFAEVLKLNAGLLEARPEGYAVDRAFKNIIYVPENTSFDLITQSVTWQQGGKQQSLPLLAGCDYVCPTGYKVKLDQPPGHNVWHLAGTVPEPCLCHKPCTVSGGGKSEISKPISDAILPGTIFVADFERDMDRVAEIIARDFSLRFRDDATRLKRGDDHRPLLSPARSLGSVIKLLTPALLDYSDDYNRWLGSFPQYLKEIVFSVKRHYLPAWGSDWRSHFSVDKINGNPGHELKCDNEKIVASYLRIGFERDGAWRVFGLREDFHPACKVQMEDDITASVTLPGATPEDFSRKFVYNCERQLFQRPDDAVHRGYDKLTERDLARSDNFISNFEPLTQRDAQALVDEAVGFSTYTAPMQGMVRAAAEGAPGPAFFVSSAHSRMVDGAPTKNPRYLQHRPDLEDPRGVHLANMGARLYRRLAADAPLYTPVDAVVPGRRNNPPDLKAGIRSLAVYGPVHHMELPELFMEFISSMTGKSPSTTGAGSEGALTKGPFNCLPATIDLNATLVQHILTGKPAFITAAGYVGPNVRTDHDISLLIPEVWARMTPAERDPAFLLTHGYLEHVEDFEYEGRLIRASRLGYRITYKFARVFFGRVFTHPHSVFNDAMLRPETQDLAAFVDGMDNVCGTHERVAKAYLADGTVELACPPLKALLHIMATGHYEGKGVEHPDIRALFTREALFSSDWYAARLRSKAAFDQQLWQANVQRLQAYIGAAGHAATVKKLQLRARLQAAEAELARVSAPEYVASLRGTLGRQPL